MAGNVGQDFFTICEARNVTSGGHDAINDSASSHRTWRSSVGVLSDQPVFPILLSRDLDATRRFYRDTLGLEVLREDADDRIVFRCGGGTQLVVTKSTTGTADTQTQMAWRVADIQAAIAELRSRGVRIEEYEAPDPVTTDGVADMGHSWAAWFVDPSRNVLSVVQPKG
jgi:catechol 2,3-dioxygenase-like lactoylglutathione lyase family enzyme